jgi:putative acetyltransferase
MPARSGPAREDLTIRAEQPEDRPAIARVIEEAFGSPAVARLVDAIRGSAGFIPELSLVGEVAGRVVGHVLVSHAELRDGATTRRIANLSPLAVHPELQRLGIGSALVREVASRADDLGEPLVVLEGSPAFYGRLGFEHSVPHGLHITLPSWAPPEAAQVLRLSRWDPSLRGQVVYPPAFDRLEDG